MASKQMLHLFMLTVTTVGFKSVNSKPDCVQPINIHFSLQYFDYLTKPKKKIYKTKTKSDNFSVIVHVFLFLSTNFIKEPVRDLLLAFRYHTIQHFHDE